MKLAFLFLYFIVQCGYINRLNLDKQLESGRRGQPTSFLHMIQKCLGTGQRVSSLERSIWNGERHLVIGADDCRSPRPWRRMPRILQFITVVSNDTFYGYYKIFRIAIPSSIVFLSVPEYLYLLPRGRYDRSCADKCNNNWVKVNCLLASKRRVISCLLNPN